MSSFATMKEIWSYIKLLEGSKVPLLYKQGAHLTLGRIYDVDIEIHSSWGLESTPLSRVVVDRVWHEIQDRGYWRYNWQTDEVRAVAILKYLGYVTQHDGWGNWYPSSPNHYLIWGTLESGYYSVLSLKDFEQRGILEDSKQSKESEWPKTGDRFIWYKREWENDAVRLHSAGLILSGAEGVHIIGTPVSLVERLTLNASASFEQLESVLGRYTPTLTDIEMQRRVCRLSPKDYDSIITLATSEQIPGQGTTDDMRYSILPYPNEERSSLEAEILHHTRLISKANEGRVPQRTETPAGRYDSDAALRDLLKQLYEWRCQICGLSIPKQDGGYHITHHHIHPRAEGGPHTMDNIIIVCPNHHAILEHGKNSYVDKESKKVFLLGEETPLLLDKHLFVE